MALTIGDRLGHYDVTALIGEGGMGCVFRATDTQLGRDVALKILPDAFAADPDRLARFQREAQVLASLNHPGIAAIYGIEKSDDTQALVLELVEGPTLADRIAKGPIPLDEALPIAKQIAEALEAAHEAGVIHRDLKPANIKVREDGTVKVLDFGLAKVLDTTPEGDPSQSPTLTAAATQMGVILGTAAYMSPEQARGKPVDRRTDIWAFGCVLYEMLTARRLFDGEDVSEVLAKVIRDDLRFDGTPRQYRRLLERCLVKDPKRRLRAVGDAWDLIGSEALSSSGSTDSAPMRWLGWGVAAVLGIGYVVGDLLLEPESTQTAPESRRFAFEGPDGVDADSLSVSPDGRHIAFVAANTDGEEQVWVRSQSTLEARPLPGTERARRSAVIWSPNSLFVAFESQRRLQRVALDGTPPLPIAELVRPPASGSWGAEGVILVGSVEGILQIPEGGGEPVRVTSGSDSVTEGHIAPWFLPDGRHFLYLRRSDNPAEHGIWIARIDTAPEEQPSERLLAADSAPVFAPPLDRNSTGHLLFERDGVLVAQAFDAEALVLGSEVTPLQAGITPGDEDLRYIADHPEVTNVLLTGGDPLLMSTRRLIEIFKALRAIPHVRIIRIGSKMPAFDPWRVLGDEDLQATFREYSTPETRIYLMAHFDYPRELTDVAIEGIDTCLRNGVVCVNQCPLIKGINDDPYVLAELFATLSYIGCPPYYLFQGRPTAGNEAYEVPIVRGWEVFQEALR